MNKYNIMLMFVVSLFVFGCTNPWDEHVKLNSDVSQESIYDYLASQSEFSTFVDLLNSSGTDVMLSSSTIYTVWAPTNEAMAAVDQSLLDSDEKKAFFVKNHIAFGSYSSKDDNSAVSLPMRSGKILSYVAAEAQIDGVSIDAEKEIEVRNGTVQVISTALSPRYSVWEIVEMVAPDCKFISFLNSQTKTVFDEENSSQVGINAAGKPVYDTVWIEENKFLNSYVDLTNEEYFFTLLVPSDEVFDAEFSKFQRYYRVDNKLDNTDPSSNDSVYIMLMIARDLALNGNYSADEAAGTAVSYYDVTVPFEKTAITNSYKASNGYVHYVNSCSVALSNKVKPIFMEAEESVYSAVMTVGSPCVYRRLRDDASKGMDFICDNSHSSQILSGVIFVGPVVSSVKYRIKIRAVNDFGKSYRNSDTSVVLIQNLCNVPVSRDAVTGAINISTASESFVYSNTTYGTADVSSDTIYVPSRDYSPLAQAEDDEIDLGYFDYKKCDNVFFRLKPLAAKMSVVADYFRLVPIFEEEQNTDSSTSSQVE